LGQKSLVKKNNRSLVWETVILSLFAQFVIIWGLCDNLGRYSIYYAQHLQHKSRTNPVMIAIIDNLDKVYIPDLDKYSVVKDWKDNRDTVKNKAGNIEYDFYSKSINYRPDLKKPMYFQTISKSREKDEYIYIYDDAQDKPVTLSFDNAGVSLSNFDEKKIQIYQNIFYGNIVKYRKKPILNFQIIYNFLNESRFN
jgi:hypothetical protein